MVQFPITDEEAIERMRSFVDEKLKLKDRDNRKKLKNMDLIRGKLFTGEESHIYIITKTKGAIIQPKYKELEDNFLGEYFHQKKDEPNKKYVSIILPRTNDSENDFFLSPYLREYNLRNIETDNNALWLTTVHKRLDRKNVLKVLSRIERIIKDNRDLKEVDYFNPKTQGIETNHFSKIPDHWVIPPLRDIDKGYNAWVKWQNMPRDIDEAYLRYLEIHRHISDKGLKKTYKVFQKIQEGLHNRVHQMSSNFYTQGSFTLIPEKSGYAKIIKYTKDKEKELRTQNMNKQLSIIGFY